VDLVDQDVSSADQLFILGYYQDLDPLDPTLNTRYANPNGSPGVLAPGLALGAKPACNTTLVVFTPLI
jgi:hypothetical protein